MTWLSRVFPNTALRKKQEQALYEAAQKYFDEERIEMLPCEHADCKLYSTNWSYVFWPDKAYYICTVCSEFNKPNPRRSKMGVTDET